MRTNARKYISLLLALCMVLSMLPATALAADGNCTGEHSGWTVLTSTSGTQTGGKYYLNGGNYYLKSDVTASGEIHTTGDVTLCLNGHTLTLPGNSLCIDSGSFTLCDCNGSGTITGGSSEGSAVIVYGGTFTMNGGTITGNAGGGVQVASANGTASFIMNGGSITGNTCTNEGGIYNLCGGVCVAGGSFTMHGGSITGNTATGSYATTASGGVLVYYGGSFTMTGGEITNNQCAVSNTSGDNGNDFAGGVRVSTTLRGGTVTVSGDAVISGNTAANGSANNVSLANGQKIKIGGGGLSSGAEIGVTMASANVFTTGGGASYRQYFFSDDDTYVVVPSNGELALGQSASNPEYAHSHPACGDNTCGQHGGSVTYDKSLTAIGGALSAEDYYLKHSVTATDNITISGAVNLCLNGRTLDLDGHHFIVNNGGSLTICDCGSGGTIIGGSAEQGGAVLVNSSGSLTLHSGSITGNTASGGGGGFSGSNRAGGGAVCVNGGSFNMTGGSIENNTANVTEKNDGGGAVLINSGSFNMSGGFITGNSVSGHNNITGGGVYVNSGTFTMTNGVISNNSAAYGGGVTVFKGTAGESSFTLSGGSITNNSATTAGGVYVASSSFTLSGAPDISNNTVGESKTASNIYLNGSVITLTGSLSNTKPYGVSMATPGEFTSGWSTYMSDKTPTSYFKSDVSGLDVQISGYELCLSSGFTVSFNLGGAEGTAPESQTVQNDDKATEPTAPTWEGHTFAGWYNDGTLWDFGNKVTGNMTLTAKWITNPTVTVSGDTSMTYGTGGTLTADVTPASGQNYAYQWYCGNELISGATGASYAIPADTAVGTYTYSCTVTASITGSSKTASATSLDVTVTVSAKGYDSSFTISPIPDQTYTGSQITPDVTVTYGNKPLTEGTDYDLSYGTNTTVGTNAGSVKITFKGNYSGETTVYFNIVYAAFPSGTTNDTVFDSYTDTSSNWSNSDSGVTFTPNDGWTVSATPNSGYGGSVTFNDDTDGEHAKTVYVKDSEGNIYKTEITYKLDKTDPAVSNVDKPAEDAVWTDENVTVSFNASDSTSGIQTVTVSKGGGAAQTITGSGGEYSFTATENGKYTVTVIDKAGNTTQKEINITNIDKAEPSLNVSGGDTSGDSLTLTVDASNTGGSRIQSVTVQKPDGTTEPVSGSYTITAPGEYTFTATTGAGVSSTVTKTVHSVTIGTDAQLVVDGGKVTKPAADPTKTGYTFDRWMNGQNEWDFDQDTVTANLILTAKWTLNAPTVELSADKNNVTYGTKITLTATPDHDASVTYTYEWYKGDTKLTNIGETLTLINVNDTGSYTVKVTATDGNQSKAAASNEVIVTINRATPDYTVPTGLTATYGDRLSSVTLPEGWTWVDGNTCVGNAGEQSHTAAFTPDDTANYNRVEQNITVQVDKATLTPSVGSVADKTYDGNTSTTGTIELEGAVPNENPAASGVFTFESANAGTDKTVKVTVTLGDGWASNYVLAETELTTKANITPKTVGLTWSGHDDLVYDGEPVSVTASATGLVSGDTCAVTVDNGDQTNASTYTAEATGLGNDNYQLPDTGTTQEYTIAPRPVELSWSASSFTYDGNEKTVTATITNLVPDDDCALTYEDNVKTEHGSYTATVTGLDNNNYTLTNGAGLTHSWSIGKAVVSFTVSGNSHTYDGDAKTAAVTQDSEQTQIPAGGYEVTYGGTASQTEAGTYDITVTITNGNFCFEDGKDTMVVGKLTIGEQAVEIPTPDDTEFVYNGAEQTYAIAENVLYTVEGNAQKDAGTYTVTVSLNDKDNYVWSDGTTNDRTYTFMINPKPVTATWVGFEQVYGSVEPVYVILSGLAEGDEDLEAVISGVSTEAGEHPLNASLKNYDIINGTATLRIQQKPVTITVTDNAVTVGGEPAISAPGLAESDYEVVYKDKNGNEVTPSEPGTYEVWVEITNPNYRHPDGSSEKQVGSVVVSTGTPRMYELSFDGSGAGGSTAGMKAAGGSVITLPECGFTKPGSVFTGWKYGSVVYKPGDSFTMPYVNVTLTAQWSPTRNVNGTVVDEENVPVAGAVVSIWQGANKLDETTTASNGGYSFTGLAPGSYNVTASVGDKTVTTAVTVDENGAVTGAEVILPEGNKSTRVEVTPGSPDVVVGELDRVFDDTSGEDYTAEDAATVQAGGKVEIFFTVDERDKAEVQDELKQLQSAASGNLALFMECALEKEVFDSEGVKDEDASGSITRSSVLLEVRLPLPSALQGKYSYSVSRIHKGEAQMLSSSANSLGEYFEVSSDKTVLTLHVCCFSTYAVGYTDAPMNITTYPPVKTESENGSFAVSPDRPFSGQTVTITPKPDEGYTVDKVTVTDASGKAVEVSPNGDGTYSFTQPSGAVTITVTFKVLTDVSECPRDASCPMSGYTDLNMGEWYHDGIHYCLDEGLMDGVDAGMFAPNATTSRAMIVTILWRLQGSPEVEATETFTDVSPDAWYAKAIAWAVAEGVADGYGEGLFGPNDAITREQLAAMLWRYAGSPEADGDLSAFADGADTSSWAEQAMSWAVARGLLTGVDNDRLAPGGQATRAQAATILMRFAQSETK